MQTADQKLDTIPVVWVNNSYNNISWIQFYRKKKRKISLEIGLQLIDNILDENWCVIYFSVYVQRLIVSIKYFPCKLQLIYQRMWMVFDEQLSNEKKTLIKLQKPTLLLRHHVSDTFILNFKQRDELFFCKRNKCNNSVVLQMKTKVKYSRRWVGTFFLWFDVLKKLHRVVNWTQYIENRCIETLHHYAHSYLFGLIYLPTFHIKLSEW